MPQFLKEENDDFTIGIWKTTESLEYYLSSVTLSDTEYDYFSKITNESRKKEYLAVRKLLLELTNKDTSIIYSQEGKPKLLNNNNANISITHTKNFVAIIISQKHITGIDIEHISDRVLRIRKKFLDTNELEWCNTVEKHIICWSAKETIFKLFGKNIDFKDIKINTFEVLENTGTINAALIKNTNKQFIVSYRKIENNFLTFTLHS